MSKVWAANTLISRKGPWETLWLWHIILKSFKEPRNVVKKLISYTLCPLGHESNIIVKRFGKYEGKNDSCHSLWGGTWLVFENLCCLQNEHDIHTPKKEPGPSKRPLSKTFHNLAWCADWSKIRLQHRNQGALEDSNPKAESSLNVGIYLNRNIHNLRRNGWNLSK